MDINTNLTQNVDTLFSNLEEFTQNQGVLGKPVTHGEKTFIPVVSLTLGYGSGNTASKNQQGNTSNQSSGLMSGMGNMAGGALGLGAKLTTDAIIVVDKDNVSFMQMSPMANASNLMDKIPQMFTGNNQNNQSQNQNQNQNQQQNQQQNQSQKQ